jgi:hypothetical protein
VLLLAIAVGCAGGSTAPRSAQAPSPSGGSRAPYDSPPESKASIAISIAIDGKTAREILEALAHPRADGSDPKVLQNHRAVALAIRDSSRTPDAFERDFAAAFQSENHPAVFDFKSVRDHQDRWRVLLDGVLSRQEDLVRLSRQRGASLLPADAEVSARLDVDFTFALPGLEDHLVVRTPEGGELMVVDFAKALSDAESAALDAQISRLSRLIGGEVCRLTWNMYRDASPSWKQSDPQLGQLEPLLKLVAGTSPVGLFGVDESFFPLSSWLKEPMKRAVDDLNHRAEQFAQAQENLDARMELTSELKRPEFARRVAAPIGAFLADAIAQDSGTAGLSAALQAGPRAFFVAYDRATQNNKELPPLGKAIKDRLK